VAVRARSGIGGESPLRGQKCHKKKFSFLPLYSNISSTSEYNRHRSFHHAISFIFKLAEINLIFTGYTLIDGFK
jgi:hypothetical protein